MRKSVVAMALVVIGSSISFGNVAHSNTQDTEPPVVQISCGSCQVVTGSPGETVSLTYRGTDNVGITSFAATLFDSSDQVIGTINWPTRISGTDQDGVFKLTIEIPSSASVERSPYPVKVRLGDLAGNQNPWPVIVGLINISTPTPTPSATPTPTPSPTPTSTPTTTVPSVVSPVTTPSPSVTPTSSPAPLPTPTPTPTSSPSPATTPAPVVEQEIEGEEVEPQGTMDVRKLLAGYRMTITSNIGAEEVRVLGTKKGARTLQFRVTLNESGKAIFRTSRNLSGYQLQLIFGDLKLFSLRVS